MSYLWPYIFLLLKNKTKQKNLLFCILPWHVVETVIRLGSCSSLGQGFANFSAKGQIRIFQTWRPWSHWKTWLCSCSVKITLDDTYSDGCGCAPVILYIQKQTVGWIWTLSCSLSTSALGDSGRIKWKQVKCLRSSDLINLNSVQSSNVGEK